MEIIKKYWLGFALLILIAISSLMIYQKLHKKTLPPNLIEGVGRIDGDVINLNTKYPGRVIKITVDKGDRVKKGEVVAILESLEFKAKKEAILAQIKAKERELLAKEKDFEILKKSLPIQTKKAKLALKANEAKLNALDRKIDSLKELVEQDRRDLKRIENLYKKHLTYKEALEKANLKYKSDLNSLKALKSQRKELFRAFLISKENLKEALISLKKIDSAKLSLNALKEAILALKASLKEVEAMIDEMSLKSFVDGFVIDKIANEGEVVGAGGVVVTLIDPKSLYLKIFVDTLQNGKIKIGDKAVIFLDAYPNKAILAKVVKIAQKAEFTPKEVNVRSDRIQRVFAVYLKPLKPNPLLKLGIDAVGVISIDGKNLPKSLNDIPKL